MHKAKFKGTIRGPPSDVSDVSAPSTVDNTAVMVVSDVSILSTAAEDTASQASDVMVVGIQNWADVEFDDPSAALDLTGSDTATAATDTAEAPADPLASAGDSSTPAPSIGHSRRSSSTGTLTFNITPRGGVAPQAISLKQATDVAYAEATETNWEEHVLAGAQAQKITIGGSTLDLDGDNPDEEPPSAESSDAGVQPEFTEVYPGAPNYDVIYPLPACLMGAMLPVLTGNPDVQWDPYTAQWRAIQLPVYTQDMMYAQQAYLLPTHDSSGGLFVLPPHNRPQQTAQQSLPPPKKGETAEEVLSRWAFDVPATLSLNELALLENAVLSSLSDRVYEWRQVCRDGQFVFVAAYATPEIPKVEKVLRTALFRLGRLSREPAIGMSALPPIAESTTPPQPAPVVGLAPVPAPVTNVAD